MGAERSAAETGSNKSALPFLFWRKRNNSTAGLLLSLPRIGKDRLQVEVETGGVLLARFPHFIDDLVFPHIGILPFSSSQTQITVKIDAKQPNTVQ